MRLYNASHSACVAVGSVIPDATAAVALDRWKNLPKLVGPSGQRLRVVVDITEAKVPSAFVQHAKSPPLESSKGRRKKRCTVGDVAPRAAMKISTPTQDAGGNDGKDSQSMPEEDAEEVKAIEVPDKVSCSDESLDLDGLVLWDIHHIRSADSYKAPLHDVVDDSGVECIQTTSATPRFLREKSCKGQVICFGCTCM